MLKRRLLNAIVLISIVMPFITSAVIGTPKAVMDWLHEQWIHIFYAIVFAIVVGVIIHYVYTKIVPKLKILQKTIELNSKPRPVLAKLVLPNNNEIEITEDEEVFRREDFVGVIPLDKLTYITRRGHFKIVRMDDGIYIEDLNTKNGTKLNGEEIKRLGRRKLEDGAEILVAKVLKIRYVVESS